MLLFKGIAKMIRKQLASALCMMTLCSAAFSQPSPAHTPVSEQYCGKLAQIGASAWRTRTDGYPMDKVLTEVNTILSGKPDTMEDAHEVIVAIYSDTSVNSSKQAYSKVYDGCKQ